MKKVRCAIYTRKSSEEGLEQDFNSLHAQREACAAYILSQAGEGWALLPEHYDDGGLSGGSLERPALQRLLTDVTAGLIDIIVVYKVDRLTRSLLDFSKLVEAFEKVGTSFVSVTQSFNTTTSMGRLTLNMLLSFAQFEREVTAERIRDKIAASKAKGMWMGGTPPIGYEPKGRSLAIVEEHAEIVRGIYGRYLALGNVRLLAQALGCEGVRSPERTSGKGRKLGGGQFGRGQLYAILKNPIYVGNIVHRNHTFEGQHPAIIDRSTWHRVQEKLADHCRGQRRVRTPNTSLLAGVIVDEAGEPLVAVHACKGKVRYRYYVTRALQQGTVEKAKGGLRVPAREIEALVAEQVAAFFDDPTRLMARLPASIPASQLREISDRCRAAAVELRQRDRGPVAEIVTRVCMFDDRVEINISLDELLRILSLRAAGDIAQAITIAARVRLTRTGRAIRLVQPDGSTAGTSAPNAALLRLLLKAREWWTTLSEGGVDISTFAREQRVTPAYMTRVVRMAFLAPAVVEAILEGRQQATTTAGSLTATSAVPASWRLQISRFLQIEDAVGF
ncbi:MAG: recombinase family protein [Pseudomonadota bacterium]|nr:recombinase family protein [Pseudomonadota bacterium]